MGAGASIDEADGGNSSGGGGGYGRDDDFGEMASRWYCHECRSYYYLGATESNVSCPHCSSVFVEEIIDTNDSNYLLTSNTARNIQRRVAMGQGQDGEHLRQAAIELGLSNERRQTSEHGSSFGGMARDRTDLTDEQVRRLQNASVMLRLLEAQLRDELESLQALYAARRQTDETSKPKALSHIQKKKLRNVVIDSQIIVSQPCCPVCSDDFVVGNKELCLPCSHFFHDSCVMPWLESKRTCPICRFELTDAVSTLDELEKWSESELEDRIKEYEPNFVSIEQQKSSGEEPLSPKRMLATRLHNHLSRSLEGKEGGDRGSEEVPSSPSRRNGNQPAESNNSSRLIHLGGGNFAMIRTVDDDEDGEGIAIGFDQSSLRPRMPLSTSSRSSSNSSETPIEFEVRRLPLTTAPNTEPSRAPLTAALSSTYVLRSSGSRDGLGSTPVATVMMPSGLTMPSRP